jgi:hypothetical protein
MAKRPILRLKNDELVQPEEDRRLELAVYDLLLPCRRFDISYKVAILGLATPTLEFLLRLVKAIPGITEEDALSFFGFSRQELEYVLEEATGPGYLDRDEGRLWLTSAGDDLFKESDDGPVIFSVEGRRGSYGFDLLAMAPERPRLLDNVEMVLPDLQLDDQTIVGQASQAVPNSFRRYFRELGERKDREQIEKRDLYSIDSVTPGDRFQVPVRIRVFAQASSPSVGEIDLGAWRADHEVSDRPQIERAAGRFLEELNTSKHPETDPIAYQTLVDLAPEFLKEFTTRVGLSVNRYWREAVSRAGEVRIDRKTIPMVGAIASLDNIERLLRVVEYGQRQTTIPPSQLISVAPQNRYWGATSLLRDSISVLRRKLTSELPSSVEADLRSVCIIAGKPAKYIERAFDRVEVIGTVGHATSLEFILIPNVTACVMVHAPIGSNSGVAAPLGFASFDPVVLDRVQSLILDTTIRYVQDQKLRSEIEQAIEKPADISPPGD